MCQNRYTWAFSLFTSIWKAATGARIERVSLGSAARALSPFYMVRILTPNLQIWRHSCSKMVYFFLFSLPLQIAKFQAAFTEKIDCFNIWKFVIATRIDSFASTNLHAKFAPCRRGFSHWTTVRLNYSLINCTIKNVIKVVIIVKIRSFH